LLPDSIDSQNTISFKKLNRPLPLRPQHYNVIPTPTHINNTTERHPSSKTPEQCTRPEIPIDNKASFNNNNNNSNNPDITGLDKRQSTPLRILPAIFLNAYRLTGSDYFFLLLPRGRAEDRSKHARTLLILPSILPPCGSPDLSATTKAATKMMVICLRFDTSLKYMYYVGSLCYTVPCIYPERWKPKKILTRTSSSSLHSPVRLTSRTRGSWGFVVRSIHTHTYHKDKRYTSKRMKTGGHESNTTSNPANRMRTHRLPLKKQSASIQFTTSKPPPRNDSNFNLPPTRKDRQD
jgi:hypothetical protein